SFLLAGAREQARSIDVQLSMVAGYPAWRLRNDLEVVWRGELPVETLKILERGGGPRIAEALRQYWAVAVQPFWPQIRAVLDADVAYRATRLARGGIVALLTDLHPQLELAGHAIEGPSSAPARDPGVRGAGLPLGPCAFAGPPVRADIGPGNSPGIPSPPRGVGELWPQTPAPPSDGDALASLLGRSRAAILRAVGLPRSTTELAVELRQTAPAVSAHLAVLRRAGLVTCWRAARRVLYHRT